MSTPLIKGFELEFNPGVPGITFLVMGSGFDSTTHFTFLDVTVNPTVPVKWSPADQFSNTITNGGTRAQVISTPIPQGGPLPNSGDLRLGVYTGTQIMPTQSTMTKTVPYTGILLHLDRPVPTISDFAPVEFTYGEEVPILITGHHFDSSTRVEIKEDYVEGVEWSRPRTLWFDRKILVVVAKLKKLGQPLSGPGYLEVNVSGEDEDNQSGLLKVVTYHAPDDETAG